MTDAMRRNESGNYETLAAVYGEITNWFTSYLADFEGAPVYQSPLIPFGKLLLREEATVITFNYDCIVESAIANASGVSHNPSPPIGDDESDLALTFSHYNWNRALCYGIRFDEVVPFRAGISKSISGETFYNHPDNQLYPNPILKLHGSINWYRYVPVRAFPALVHDDSPAPAGSILQVRSNPSGFPDIRGGWMTKRELITPVLYKQQWLQTNMFDILWQRALDELASCRRLVIIGYSFPPTDFPTKRLFIEAFATRPALEELVIVNPDPPLHLVRRLTHHHRSISSLNILEDFITTGA